MSKPPASSGASRRSRDRCGRPVLRQLVGRRAAPTVTADARPLTAAQALELTGPNRLAWCLREGAHAGLELRWWHWPPGRTDCPHQHVIDHQCPTRDPGRSTAMTQLAQPP